MQIDSNTRSQLLGLGLGSSENLSLNATAAELYELSIMRGEASVAEGGSLVVTTGAHTGRSPNDKFIVRDCNHRKYHLVGQQQGHVAQPLPGPEAGFSCACPQQQPVHPGFDRRRRSRLSDANPCDLRKRLACPLHPASAHCTQGPRGFSPNLTVIDLPSFKADPGRHGTRSQTVIAIDLTNGLVLIGGTQYAGEIKKAVFTVLNYLLPERGVMPMHCSANTGSNGDTTVFFGLSGTGKTTLSADASRTLIGDDEHGWSPAGVFNFEGGCYAKVIRLSAAAEPEIFATTRQLGHRS